ncbi:phage tail protein I, partial [Mesorhizobium sp. M00.F.Ca.ET.186.01.1.1]
MVDIYSVSLADILPENLKADPQVQALAEAITPELQVIAQAINECLLLPRLDELPEDIVDLLAWQYHVDFYDSSLPLEKKRELVKQANTTHRYKGTPWAIDKVVSTAFDEAVVSEWFEYGGEPGYFKVTTTDRM